MDYVWSAMKPANLIQHVLHKHFSIEPGENSLVHLFLLYFTLISAFYTASLAASEALFISQFTTAQLKMILPWIYISIALITILMAWIYDRFIDQVTRSNAIIYSDIFFAIAILIMKLIVDTPGIGGWSYFLLVVLLEAFSLFKIMLFFSYMGDYFAVHHAKRLYAYIINGMALGSITGGFIVAFLSYYIKITDLLLVSIILIILSSLVAIRISSISILKQGKTTDINQSPINLKIIFKNNYIKMLFLLTVIIAIVGVVVDFTMLLAASKVLNERGLAIFFGKFFFYVGIIQLVLEVSAGTWLTNRFGLQRNLLLLPISIIIACVAYFIFPVLLFAASINFIYLTFTETTDISARQMLFLLLPTRMRLRSQSISDGMIASLGKILGGIIILLFALLNFNIFNYIIVIIVFSSLWILSISAIVPKYKKLLSQSVMKPFLFAVEVISGFSRKDIKTFQLESVNLKLIESLQNFDDDQQKLIIHMLPRSDFLLYKKLIIKLLNSSSESVTKEILKKFERYGATADLPIIKSMLHDERKSILSTAILAYAHIIGKKALSIIADRMQDSDDIVKSAAVSASYKYGGAKGKKLAKSVIKSLLSNDPRLAVKLIGNLNIVTFYDDLNNLLQSTDETVRYEAILACKKCHHPLFIDQLLKILIQEKNQQQIINALVSMPSSASMIYHSIYEDQTQSLEVRGIILQIMSRRGDVRALSYIILEISNRTNSLLLFDCYHALKLFPENTVIKLLHKKTLNSLLLSLAADIIFQVQFYEYLGHLSVNKRIIFRDTIYLYHVIYFSLLAILYGIKDIEGMASLYSGREINISHAAADDVLSTIAHKDITTLTKQLKLSPDSEIIFLSIKPTNQLLEQFTCLSQWHQCLAKLISETDFMKTDGSQLLNKLIIVTVLKKTDIFKDIPTNELFLFAGIAQEYIYYPGEILFKEGDHGDCLYLIVSGSVRIHVAEREIAVLEKGECIGELSLLDNLPRSATATILQESQILKINADDFLNLITLYPDISKRLLKILSLRLRSTTEKWVEKQ